MAGEFLDDSKLDVLIKYYESSSKITETELVIVHVNLGKMEKLLDLA